MAVKGIIGFISTLPRAQPEPTTHHYLQVSNTGEESEINADITRWDLCLLSDDLMIMLFFAIYQVLF